jgi:hypothetical protein
LLEEFLKVGEELFEANGPDAFGFELGGALPGDDCNLNKQFSEDFGHTK